MTSRFGIYTVVAAIGFFVCLTAEVAMAQSDWKKDWERVQQDAKKEGAIVVGIPARAELRKQIEAVFKPKFAIDMDLSTARGPQNASRIAAEYAAGVKNFDVFIGGSGTFESLVAGGMVEPLDALMLLPEVKETKQWWGGHIWEDNLSGNRHLYSFIAEAGTGGLWFNTEAAKPNELRSFDDLLNPKWKGKIGFLTRAHRARVSRCGLICGIKRASHSCAGSCSKICSSAVTSANWAMPWPKAKSPSP